MLFAKLLLKPVQILFAYAKAKSKEISIKEANLLIFQDETDNLRKISTPNKLAVSLAGGLKALLSSNQLCHAFHYHNKKIRLVDTSLNNLPVPILLPKLINYLLARKSQKSAAEWEEIERALLSCCKRSKDPSILFPTDVPCSLDDDVSFLTFKGHKNHLENRSFFHDSESDNFKVVLSNCAINSKEDNNLVTEDRVNLGAKLLLVPVQNLIKLLKVSKISVDLAVIDHSFQDQKLTLEVGNGGLEVVKLFGGWIRILESECLGHVFSFKKTMKRKEVALVNRKADIDTTDLFIALRQLVDSKFKSYGIKAQKHAINRISKLGKMITSNHAEEKLTTIPITEAKKESVSNTALIARKNIIRERKYLSRMFDIFEHIDSYFNHEINMLLVDLLLEPLQVAFVYKNLARRWISLEEIENLWLKVFDSSHPLGKSITSTLQAIGTRKILTQLSINMIPRYNQDNCSAGDIYILCFSENCWLYSVLQKTIDHWVNENVELFYKKFEILKSLLIEDIANSTFSKEVSLNSSLRWYCVAILVTPLQLIINHLKDKTEMLSLDAVMTLILGKNTREVNSSIEELKITDCLSFLLEHNIFNTFLVYNEGIVKLNKDFDDFTPLNLLKCVNYSLMEFQKNSTFDMLEKLYEIGREIDMSKFSTLKYNLQLPNVDLLKESEAVSETKNTKNNTFILKSDLKEEERLTNFTIEEINKHKAIGVALRKLLEEADTSSNFSSSNNHVLDSSKHTVSSASTSSRKFIENYKSLESIGLTSFVKDNKLKASKELQKLIEENVFPKNLILFIFRKCVIGIKSFEKLQSYVFTYYCERYPKLILKRVLRFLEEIGFITSQYPRKLTDTGALFLKHPSEWGVLQHTFISSNFFENVPCYISLEQSLQNFQNDIRPDTVRTTAMKAIIKKLLKSLRKLEGPVKIACFGSYRTGLMTKNSDLDLVIYSSKEALLPYYDRVKSIIKNEFSNVMPIRGARIPIIKFTGQYNIHCDLSFDNLLPIHNSDLILNYSLIDERVKTLLMLVKYWASNRLIDKTHHAFPSSYTWCIMVIFYLQQIPEPILPNLQKLSTQYSKIVRDNDYGNVNCWFNRDTECYRGSMQKGRKNIALLLRGFFCYYGLTTQYSFDWEAYMIDISSSQLKRKSTEFKDCPFVVLDPFLKKKNLTKALTQKSVKVVRYELERACRILSDPKCNLDHLLDPLIQ
ncbi:Polynucleotide adenylyltransferase [Schizosaccharomyces pombe]|uniref:Caffeine-induced protein 16 n=1 Tax=Schizosaccharomyces pombe (strain 972 / ATCC 24843) TaxID=284812 RepID=CID16_SCHPO|nr:putative poly(A) polymerase Cid16 [Schizosaccharomyces pombe]O13798.1 RecName: Full=Caffeine-induced protein 16 [Schizosaccharomyces pombe 972h-]CAB11210.1 poly(A) polymerase Cid16 (predicted) [Schizosaccharomyces pombe]|eukprot:NP_593571.1 putative poly(A) polymerase Cid16 [Schizosaccharomyces pombe]